MPKGDWKAYLKWRQQRAQTLRQLLLVELQAFCRHCMAEEKLEFDLINAGGDEHHRMNPYDRMRFYWREHHKANVQVLCEVCNARKGDGPNLPQQQTLELTANAADCPF